MIERLPNAIHISNDDDHKEITAVAHAAEEFALISLGPTTSGAICTLTPDEAAQVALFLLKWAWDRSMVGDQVDETIPEAPFKQLRDFEHNRPAFRVISGEPTR